MKHIALALMVVMLAACGAKRAPDESRVVAGPSLTLPPEYELVPPNKVGVATPAERAANNKVDAAQEALVGSEAEAVTTKNTEAAKWLLDGKQVDSNIRSKLAVEKVEKAEEEAQKGWLKKLEDKLRRNEQY